MKIGVYFCRCGTNIAEKIEAEKVKQKALAFPGDVHFAAIDFLCSEDGVHAMEQDLKENNVDRCVVAACSPRDHEKTFMGVMERAGRNPYFMQMVNIREQVAWVVEDSGRATEKAARYVSAAMRRVLLHEPLEQRAIDVCPDMLIIGAGPAGLKAALTMAESGRKVSLVEKSPAIGGLPVRFEDLFPKMECGPCMLEPVMGEVLHGAAAENIELLNMAEVTGVVGSYGNFTVRIEQQPRYVDTHACVGCAECIEPCPANTLNEFNCNLSERKAIAFPYAGALPNAPFIDPAVCIRMHGEECQRCKDACPVEGAIRFDECVQVVERNVGAILIAIGAHLYDCRQLPNLGYGAISDVHTSLEFERILASNGPTSGELRTADGTAPAAVAVVHCVGSLDKDHKEYCSGVCCQYSFKFNHLIRKRLPGAKVYHYYKELVYPGKEEFASYHHATDNPDTTLTRYGSLGDLAINKNGGQIEVRCTDVEGVQTAVPVDMVVLCPAIVPGADAAKLGALLEVTRDNLGFFEEVHGRMDSAQARVKGVYLAGTCQAPMDIQKAMLQGMASAGYVLSGLVIGRKLEISPVTASVNADRCSGCRVCGQVCPYKAISYDATRGVSSVNDVLCQGCGTCVAACPAGAITGNHFTAQQILAELEEVLQ
jgi:heterodisulfide reductase subunit A2